MLDYDKLAAEYALHRRLHPGVLRELLATGALTASSAVLEVGCGTGNYVNALESATGCAGFGVDPSQEMLSRAMEQNEKVQWQFGKAEQLPIEPELVDLVFSVDVIHHVADRLGYFQEAFRVLRRGGKICTVTDSDWIIRERAMSRYFPESVPVELRRYPAIGDLRALKEEAGFVQFNESTVEHETALADIQPYRDKAFSALHLISEAALAQGITRMEQDLRVGPIPVVSRYVLMWGTKP